MSPRRRVDEARLALMLLTRLPVGRLADPAPTLAQAQWAYPPVGLVVGALGWAALQGALALGLDALAAALCALAAMALFTGGLHHDGLADFADAMSGGRDKAHRLAIMRDSRIGSHGALALMLALALGAAALGALGDALTLAAALLVSVASRLAMLGALVFLPPAREDGLGHGAAAASRLSLLPGALLVAGLAAAAGRAAPVALGAIGLAALAIALQARRRVGGQTGDVLGAVQIGSETAGWLALSACMAA